VLKFLSLKISMLPIKGSDPFSIVINPSPQNFENILWGLGGKGMGSVDRASGQVIDAMDVIRTAPQ